MDDILEPPGLSMAFTVIEDFLKVFSARTYYKLPGPVVVVVAELLPGINFSTAVTMTVTVARNSLAAGY